MRQTGTDTYAQTRKKALLQSLWWSVEMARITKNASECCPASANLVHMLHRTAGKHILVHATPHRKLATLLNIHQHHKKISSVAYDIQKN